MDRRRFSPMAEALDGRVLLSGMSRPQSAPIANLHQKTVRIEHLPAALASLETGRQLDMNIVRAIQTDLRGLVGRLSQPSPAANDAAQLQFRTTLSHASISQEDAAALRSTFRSVLQSAGASPAILEDLSSNMDRLVQLDTNAQEPAKLAANDYALILQTVLGVGRPIRKPAAPTLYTTDDTGAKGDRTTTLTQPRLTGHYDSTATIQLLDQSDRVIGTATVNAGGQYLVAPSSPLSLGKHTLRIKAIDANNDPSPPSRAVTITIVAPRERQGVTTTTTVTKTTSTPAGPLGF